MLPFIKNLSIDSIVKLQMYIYDIKFFWVKCSEPIGIIGKQYSLLNNTDSSINWFALYFRAYIHLIHLWAMG